MLFISFCVQYLKKSMNYKGNRIFHALFTLPIGLCSNNCSLIEKSNNMEHVVDKNTKSKETELAYLNDTYLMEDKAILLETGKDAKGVFAVFDRTIFYPQGGGQPSDLGIIQVDEMKYNVVHVAFSEGKVLHYLDNIDGIKENSNVLMNVDSERRIINAKAHTAGHLLDAISRTVAPEIIGKKGYHFSDGPYVEFEGALKIQPEIFTDKVNSLLMESIKEELPIEVLNADSELLKTLKLPVDFKIPEGKKCRFVQIGKFPPVPCGGTHLKNLFELKGIAIKKVHPPKKGLTKISYVFF